MLTDSPISGRVQLERFCRDRNDSQSAFGFLDAASASGGTIVAVRTLSRLVRMMFDRRLQIRGYLGAGLACECLTIGLAVTGPYLLKCIVDDLGRPDANFLTLAFLSFLFAIAAGGDGAGVAFRHHCVTHMVEAIARSATLGKLRFELRRLAKEEGDDAGRVFGQVERLTFNLHILIEGVLLQLLPLAVQTLISLCILMTMVPLHYAALIAAILALYTLASCSGAARFQKQVERTNEKAASLSALISDILVNAPRIVFNGNVGGELRTVDAHARARAIEAVQGTKGLIGSSLLRSVVIIVGLALLLLMAAHDVLEARLGTGDFVLVQAYAIRLTLPLGTLGFLVRQAGRSMADVEEMLNVASIEEELPASTRAGAAKPVPVILSNLSFRYGASRWVIDGIDATLPAGGLTVLVGANGSGKSTLARLIAGLLDPSGGQIHVGDICLADIHPHQRHDHILYVPQHIGLLNRSLGDNGLYPQAGLDGVQLLDFLEELRFYPDLHRPDLDLSVGEHARALSGGQAQKLELARLAGTSVPVIILDETMSALDPASESVAVELLRRERQDSSLILVTHRRSSAARADQVLFLGEGRLLHVGTHAALMRQRDYCEFWDGETSEDGVGCSASA